MSEKTDEEAITYIYYFIKGSWFSPLRPVLYRMRRQCIEWWANNEKIYFWAPSCHTEKILSIYGEVVSKLDVLLIFGAKPLEAKNVV